MWAATVAVRAEGLLLLDDMERAGETRSGGRGATGDAGWLAGALWICMHVHIYPA